MTYFLSQAKYVKVSQVFMRWRGIATSQLAFTCSKLTIGTLEQGVKYVES